MVTVVWLEVWLSNYWNHRHLIQKVFFNYVLVIDMWTRDNLNHTSGHTTEKDIYGCRTLTRIMTVFVTHSQINIALVAKRDKVVKIFTNFCFVTLK
jgi:hypothetical protein